MDGVLKTAMLSGSRRAAVQSFGARASCSHRMRVIAACGFGKSGFASTFHTPRSAQPGCAFDGAARNRLVARGCADDGGR